MDKKHSKKSRGGMSKLFDWIWQGKLSRLRAVLLACLQEVRIFAIVYRYGIRAEDG